MRIRLIGTVAVPPISGHDRQIIEVTEENQDVAESLVLCGSARMVKEAEEVVVGTKGPQGEKLDRSKIPQGVLDAANGPKLTNASLVAELSQFEIHGRYIKALTDAGCVTVGDVVAKSATLADIPGISDAAAKNLYTTLKESVEE